MNPEPALFETLQELGIALGLGLLVGMQRERTEPRIAGIRTFPLLTMLGTITAVAKYLDHGPVELLTTIG